jgi:hypothetical protein
MENASAPSDAPPRPLCTAAATSVLIDVDKGVRPCCSYEGKHLPHSLSVGRLGETSLADVLAGEAWSTLREQLDRHEVPPGCANCISRERVSGRSERTNLEDRLSPNWHRGITYLELNSSNLCNLQCRHCSSFFSSRWSAHERRHGRPAAPVKAPDTDMLLRNLRGVDLSHLDAVALKGGEPMLNEDARVLLQHCEQLGVLEGLTVYMVTNGTVIEPRLLELLRRVKRCQVGVSVDGVGGVQTYIRHGASELERLEEAIAVYAAMPNVVLTRNTSVMAYNVFCLDRLDAWWDGLAARFPGRLVRSVYGLFVLDPAELAVNVLQDATRTAVRDRYQALDAQRYAPVIRMLDRRFAGARLHDAFVRRTRQLDAELGRSVLDVVPELAAEMELLQPEAVR